MDKDEIKQVMIEYAEWLKDFKEKYKVTLIEKVIKAMPSMDPNFEDKKLVFAIRGVIEKVFGEKIDGFLKPVNAEQDPSVAIAAVDKAVKEITKSKEYQELVLNLKEVFEKAKPEIIKAFNSIARNKNAAQAWDTPHESETEFFAFEGENCEKALTADEVDQIIDSLKNKDQTMYKSLIPELIKLNPLDLIWHERFSEFANSAFGLLNNVHEEHEKTLLTFLRKLLETCKSSIPQKAVELYNHWLNFMLVKLTKEEPCETAFLVIVEENEIIPENEFLVEEELIQTTVEAFCKLLTISIKLLINSKTPVVPTIIKGINYILDAEIINRWMMYRGVRKHMSRLASSPLVSFHQLKTLIKNPFSPSHKSTASLIISLQETFCIHRLAEAEPFWDFLFEVLKLLYSDEYTEFIYKVCDTIATLIRYNLAKIRDAELDALLCLLHQKTTLSVKSRVMGLLSLCLSRYTAKLNIVSTVQLCSKDYNLQNAEYNAHFMELLEAAVVFMVRNKLEHNLAEILHSVADKANSRKPIAFLLIKLARFHCVRDYICKHFIELVADLLTESLWKRCEMLLREFENALSLLILNKKFVKHLFEVKYFEKVLDEYIESKVKGEGGRKAKQILYILLHSPTFLRLYSEFDGERFEKLLENMLDTKKAAFEDVLHANLKVIKKIVGNPANEFVYHKHNLSAKLAAVLSKISLEEKAETENTSLISSIVPFNPMSRTRMIEDSKVPSEGTARFIEALNSLKEGFCIETAKIVICSVISHFANINAKPFPDYEKISTSLTPNQILNTSLPISQWLPAFFHSFPQAEAVVSFTSKTLQSPFQTKNLEPFCNDLSNEISRTFPRLFNFFELNCCPLVLVLFAFISTNGLSYLSINHSILFATSILLSDSDTIAAKLIGTFLEEKLEPYEFIGIDAVHQKLYSERNLVKFPEDCIRQIIKFIHK